VKTVLLCNGINAECSIPVGRQWVLICSDGLDLGLHRGHLVPSSMTFSAFDGMGGVTGKMNVKRL